MNDILKKTPIPENPLKLFLGAGAMALAVFVFTVTNIFVKDLKDSYSLWQLVFFRHGITFLLGLGAVLWQRKKNLLKTSQTWPLSGCGFLGALGLFALFQSFARLPLADATALSYTSLLFVTVLSYPLLKEKVGLFRACLVGIGFGGVLMLARPTGQGDFYGWLFGCAFGLIDAFLMTQARLLTRKDHPLTFLCYFSFAATVTSGFFMVLSQGWRMPGSWEDFMSLCFLGIGGGIGQYFVTKGCSLAPTIVVTPMMYTSLIWAILFGWIFFQESPSPAFWWGAPLIILSGLGILFRESFRAKGKKNLP